MGRFNERRLFGLGGAVVGAMIASGAQAVPGDIERGAPVAVAEAIQADGILYCGQQDRNASCQPKFAREGDERIFDVVQSPAVIEALQDGNNLRVHLDGIVVMASIFAPDRLRVSEFDVKETLKGGALSRDANDSDDRIKERVDAAHRPRSF